MTNAEFHRLSIDARNSLSTLTREVMKRIKAVYIEAARNVAEQVALADLASTFAGQSELTTASRVSIYRQLEEEAAKVAAAIESNGKIGLNTAVAKIGTANDTFLAQALNDAGVVAISRQVVAQIVSGVNAKVVESVVNRVWSDGYTFSKRCWLAGQRFQDDIKNVLATGLAEGRDALEIAKDINLYTRDGKVKLMQRWGKLHRGSREFARRIPKNVDWRAMRLVRTELYISLRDAGVQHGLANPACIQEWDWVRQSSTDWGCACPDYAKGSPYKLNDLPSTPHANCLCAVVPRMVPIEQFTKELQAWANGESQPRIQQWFDDYYLPAERVA